MKIIEVPEFNDDGSIKLTHMLNQKEAQYLLQFALNFLLSTGQSAVSQSAESTKQMELPLQ